MSGRATLAVVLGATMAVLGLAVIARSVAAGVGGGLGLVIGLLLLVAGCLRVFLELARRR